MKENKTHLFVVGFGVGIATVVSIAAAATAMVVVLVLFANCVVDVFVIVVGVSCSVFFFVAVVIVGVIADLYFCCNYECFSCRDSNDGIYPDWPAVFYSSTTNNVSMRWACV